MISTRLTAWFREHWFELIGVGVVVFYVFFAFPALFDWRGQSKQDRAVLAPFERQP